MYIYRFRAVLESCTYIRGYGAGTDSMPRFIARVSAVFMLDFEAPNACGMYVTRVRIGIILAVSHAVDGGRPDAFTSNMQSLAAAVIIG